MWQCDHGKHKLTQLKQSELSIHKYIVKFGDMVEHAYSIKVTDSASVILASNFIEGVQNPHVKNKLKSYQVKNLKDIFGHVIQEDQKQKIGALDFRANPQLETTPNCSINAIRDKGCFKCCSKDHFVKDCPLSQPDNIAHKGHYMDHRNAHHNDSTTDKVMEPLTRLFTDLVVQLKVLTPSGQGSHGGTPNCDGKGRNGWWMGFCNGHRQHTNDHFHKWEEPHKDHHHKTPFRHNGHQWGSKDGHNSNFSKKPPTRIHEIESDSECNSECSAKSNLEEHLEEGAQPVPTSPKN